MNDLPGYDTWKTAYPPEWDDREPSEEHFQEAFEELCGVAELLCEFLESQLLLGDYREWLGGRLADKAEAIMKADIERGKEDAAEAAAEAREYARDDF
jgi:hypothetical protein